MNYIGTVEEWSSNFTVDQLRNLAFRSLGKRFSSIQRKDALIRQIQQEWVTVLQSSPPRLDVGMYTRDKISTISYHIRSVLQIETTVNDNLTGRQLHGSIKRLASIDRKLINKFILWLKRNGNNIPLTSEYINMYRKALTREFVIDFEMLYNLMLKVDPTIRGQVELMSVSWNKLQWAVIQLLLDVNTGHTVSNLSNYIISRGGPTVTSIQMSESKYRLSIEYDGILFEIGIWESTSPVTLDDIISVDGTMKSEFRDVYSNWSNEENRKLAYNYTWWCRS
jgi:hypothetical protein